MINRSELVTAALLGTDRRAPNFLGEAGEHEPATLLLDQAARSAVALRAGVVLPQVPPAPSGPLDELIMAPAAAQSIMSRLLARPVIELINLWLASAAMRGLGLAPPLWSAVILLAARSPGLDRMLARPGPRSSRPVVLRAEPAVAAVGDGVAPRSRRADGDTGRSRNRQSLPTKGSGTRSWIRSPSCGSRSSRRSPIMIIRSSSRDPRSTAAARRGRVLRRADRAGRGG